MKLTGFFGGQTTDGNLWYSYGLTTTWDLTIQETTQTAGTTSLVTTPLPSSALLLLTPLALIALRRRRQIRL